MEKIGLIAGNGQFPVLFSEASAKRGIEVFAVAHIGETPEELSLHVKNIEWIHVGQIGKLVKFFHKNGISNAVMAGGIKKTRMFKDVRPDFKALMLLRSLRHTRDDGVLRGFASFLEKEGIKILASTFIMPELLASEGCWTKRKPTRSEQKDMEFGWNLARKFGELDIGQCIVVQGRSVLAIEAIDGSDATIIRGGNLGNGQAVVVKICKPNQDIRFDLPAIGLQTAESMKQGKASVLLVEAEKTIVFDKNELILKANEYGISIVGKLCA